MRRARLRAYSARLELFSNDLLIRKPLTKKNTGTPGNSSMKRSGYHERLSGTKYGSVWVPATCSAAARRIRSKLFLSGIRWRALLPIGAARRLRKQRLVSVHHSLDAQFRLRILARIAFQGAPRLVTELH